MRNYMLVYSVDPENDLTNVAFFNDLREALAYYEFLFDQDRTDAEVYERKTVDGIRQYVKLHL